MSPITKLKECIYLRNARYSEDSVHRSSVESDVDPSDEGYIVRTEQLVDSNLAKERRLAGQSSSAGRSAPKNYRGDNSIIDRNQRNILKRSETSRDL